MKSILTSVCLLLLCSSSFAMVAALTVGDNLITYGTYTYKAPISGSITIQSVTQISASTSVIAFNCGPCQSNVTVSSSTLAKDISDIEAQMTAVQNLRQTLSPGSPDYAHANEQYNTLSNISRAMHDMQRATIRNIE